MMIIKKSLVNLEIKGKPNPENHDLFDSSERLSFSDGYSSSDESGYNYRGDENIDSDGDFVVNEEEGIIYACNSSTDNLIKFSKNKKNIIISNNKKINLNWDSIDEDLRYSNIISGSSNIMLEKFYSNEEDYILFIKNASKNAFPISKITIIDKRKIINSIANYCNFKRMDTKISDLENNQCKIVINKNKLDKIAYVKVSENHGFICDLAESYQDKVTGLQDRDVLYENTGMLFLYKNSSDLYFHMGNVKFAIDILFLDENNKILKIFSNIKPKTLGTFGCANSKAVLEITGGFCKENNVNVGDYIEYSKLSVLNKKDLNEALSPSNKSLSKFAKLSRYDSKTYKSILAIDESSILSPENSMFLLNNSKVKWGSLKLFDSNDIKYSNIKISSFSNNINKDSIEYPFADRIIIYGNINDSNVNKIALSKFFEAISLKNINFDILNTKNLSQVETAKAISNKYGADKVFFTSGPLYKTASFPVSESVKDLAKKSDERLLICLKKLTSILNDLDQNVNAYSAYKDDQSVISSSKAQFHQSVKKIIEKYENMLESAKASMKILYKIKDASQVEDNIKGIAQSVAMLSEVLNKIFDLVKKIDDIEFFNNLSDLTQEFKNLSKDAEYSIKGCREFIHSHILGVLILS